MKFMATLAAAIAALAASFVAEAITIEPMPGSAPQSARPGAYFIQPVGVVVRDDNGAPIANADVQLNYNYDPATGTSICFCEPGGGGGWLKTDANGVAQTLHIVASSTPGVVRPFAAVASYTWTWLPELTILPKPAVTLELVSGWGLAARVGESLPQPWVVRVIDEDGAGVPYAYVDFDGRGLPQDGFPANATFDGQAMVAVRADENGVARITPRAGSEIGSGIGYACGWTTSGDCVSIWFQVTGTPAPGDFYMLTNPPYSSEVGKQMEKPFVMQILDAGGNPLEGVPVTWETGDCGTLEGAHSATTLSDAAGHATAPVFHGLVEGYCAVFATVAGGPYTPSAQMDVQVFEARDVEIRLYPDNDTLHVTRSQPFSFWVDFIVPDEFGNENPVYGLPAEVQVWSLPGGPSAQLVRQPYVPADTYSALFEFKANSKKGSYFILIKRGPVHKWILVDQGNH